MRGYDGPMQPRRRSVVGLASLGLVVVVVGAACGGAIDNTDLFNKDQGTSGSSGATPTATATTTPTPTATGGPVPAPTPQPKPDPACVVSFSKNVMTVLVENGCTNTMCHGGGTPYNEPGISANDAALTYKNLVTFTLSTGKRYVVVGNTAPKASGIFCNLRSNCGVGMPPGED